MSGERTEAPTPKRLRDARARGHRPRFAELAPASVMAAGALWFALAGQRVIEAGIAAFRHGLAPDIRHGFQPLSHLAAIFVPLAVPLVLIIFAVFVAAAAPALLAGAPHLAAAAPRPGRLDPLAGLARMVGPSGFAAAARALAKAALIGAAAFAGARTLLQTLLPLARADPAAAAARAVTAASPLLLAVAGALALIAAIDSPLAAIRHRDRLRMTRDEVRQEARETEGSPETRAAQRRRMREARRVAPVAAVASAAVVLTNPEHFAVALRYRREEDQAPIVVGRGRGRIALRMRVAAGEAAVPCLDYPELARALYFTAREGDAIDPALYAAVAAVLAFVFALDERAARVAPAIEVPPTFLFDEHGRHSR